MSLPGADFEEDAVGGGQLGFFKSEQAGVCKDVDMGALKGCGVGAFFHRLNDGLTVNDNQPCPKLFGTPGRFADCCWRDVGEFHPRDGEDVPVLPRQGAVLGDLLDDSIQVTRSNVVGDADSLVASLMCSSY